MLYLPRSDSHLYSCTWWALTLAASLEAMKSGSWMGCLSQNNRVGWDKQSFQAKERSIQTWEEELILLARKTQGHLGGIQKLQPFLSPPRTSSSQISGPPLLPNHIPNFHIRNFVSLILIDIVILQSTQLNLGFGFQQYLLHNYNKYNGLL